MARVIVVGIGNLLMTDDGVGIHLIKALQKRRLPRGVELVDGGTVGCDLLPLLTGADKLIIVDALLGGGEPGAVYRVPYEECRKAVAPEPGISLHDLGVMAVLRDLELLEGLPEVVIIGVEPKQVALGTELTPEVAERLPALVELVLREIGESSVLGS